MSIPIVIGRKGCIGCDDLKAYLKDNGIKWKIMDAGTTDGLTEIAYNGLDPKNMEFPIIITTSKEMETMVQTTLAVAGLFYTLYLC